MLDVAWWPSVHMWEFHPFHKPAGEVVWSSFYRQRNRSPERSLLYQGHGQGAAEWNFISGFLTPEGMRLAKHQLIRSPPQPHPRWLYELWPLKCLVSFSSMTGSLNLFSATWKWKVKVAQFVSNSLRPHGLYSPWNSPGQNTRVGSFSLLQGNLPNPGIKPRSPTSQVGSLPAEPQEKPKNTGVSSLSLLQWIFPTQELNRSLLHCRRTLYQLSYQGSPFSQLRASKIDRWQISCVCVCVLVKW